MIDAYENTVTVDGSIPVSLTATFLDGKVRVAVHASGQITTVDVSTAQFREFAEEIVGGTDV
jgi:hypothetical protein